MLMSANKKVFLQKQELFSLFFTNKEAITIPKVLS